MGFGAHETSSPASFVGNGTAVPMSSRAPGTDGGCVREKPPYVASRGSYTQNTTSIQLPIRELKKTYHVTRRLHVYDVEQIAAAAEVPDGPLDGVLGLLGAVDGDHEVALVLVVAGVGGVERWEGSFPQEMGGVS